MRIQIPVPEAGSFDELATLTVEHLRDAQYQNLSVVIGPLTTGGCGCRKLNNIVFDAAIAGIAHRSVRVFDQLPFETMLVKLVAAWRAAGNEGYCHAILDRFYHGVFACGAFKGGTAFALPGWQDSVGARWEMTMLPQLGVQVVRLRPQEVAEFLALQGIANGQCAELMEHIGRVYAA